ncbi:DegT/DnrJ/EryC1/StrS family aminotransferase [Salinivibrio sp. IB643]|uniref:DegT/DnrJ/EryC1/StrS family aminotransferase n=1 Tax=Salinivibrio sp. IB643 TaxID=1909445 RepID=UPI000988C711|nr:DegT/DnrJ/EryC1/StrS family aminotransferase [Salinivibrio sp. IB643]OOE92703.1 aminotransferase DegT [Salinivibrio sp. IB643]
MIPLNKPVQPDLRKLEKFLDRINNKGWYTNFGPIHQELTEKLKEYLGVENLLLTNNGTSALQVAARAIDTKSILSTPFSFVATVSAFKWQKDELAFTDIDPITLNLSPQKVEAAYQKGCKADTVVATHVYGNPCNVDELTQVSKKNKFQIIYDAAHAFGVKINDEPVLNHGAASTLSFHATKLFHTIEGGAIIFKDKSALEKAEEIINFGIRPERGIVDVGINAKLNEYQAAVGLVNLEVIDSILEHRVEMFYRYRKNLEDVVELPKWHPNSNCNGAYMPILLKNGRELHDISNRLGMHGIQTRNYFSPSLDKVFVDSHNYGSKVSLASAERVLCLPMHSYLSAGNVDEITNIIKKAL